LTAACLKVQGLAGGPVSTAGIFASHGLQLAAIELEVVLGLWLLSGKHPIGSWLTALATFAVFAAVSSYQAWIGQASCGCFGKLSVAPEKALTIDLAALAALLVGRPNLQPLWATPWAVLGRALATAVRGLLAITLFLALFAGTASLWFGSANQALAHLRGERISIRPGLVDIGTGDAGEDRAATLELVYLISVPRGYPCTNGLSSSCPQPAGLTLNFKTLTASEADLRRVLLRAIAYPSSWICETAHRDATAAATLYLSRSSSSAFGPSHTSARAGNWGTRTSRMNTLMPSTIAWRTISGSVLTSRICIPLFAPKF
jgi:hypothetical protein